MKIYFILSLLSISSFVYGDFSAGLGYIKPGEYRVDNEINPLPLGLSVVPMIAYRGERLSILGPNIRYALVKGMMGISTRLSASGDRYRSQDLDQRDTAIVGGVSVRLIMLTLSHASDISHVHNGNISKATLGWRFKIGEVFSLSPHATKELLNSSYVNYYYGVGEDESDSYTSYEAKTAINDIYGSSFMAKTSEESSIAINYSYKKFDRVIYSSPTVEKKSFGTWSIFWTHKL